MLKIVIIAIVSALIIIYLKSINSELFSLALIGAGLILVGFSIEYLSKIITFFNDLTDTVGLSNEIYLIIFKVSSIGFLVEFSADTITDMGFKGLADKLILVGKLAIFSISIPIFYSVLNLITGILK